VTATAPVRHTIQTGEHACLIYATDEEQAEVLRGFVEDGLEREERVVVVDGDGALEPDARERGQLVPT